MTGKALPGLAAAGLIAVAVALLAAGCTAARAGAAGTGATADATPAAVAPATVPPATVPAAPTAAPTPAVPTTTAPASRLATASGPAASVTRTRVEVFDPWTAAGTLLPGIRVAHQVSGSGCTMSSSFDPANPRAWRCTMTSGGFYDPCFAPPGKSGVTRLACMDSPWSGATIISVARPLASGSRGGAALAAGPWAMVLANGQQCGLIEGTGTALDGSSLNFGCPGGGASFPRTRTEPWSVGYAATGSGSVAAIAVSAAWA